MEETHLKLKRTWLLKSSNTSSRLWLVGSKFTCVLVTGLCKVWLRCFNSSVIHNREEFVAQVESDNDRHGIITVSNHHSCMDDPMMWGRMVSIPETQGDAAVTQTGNPSHNSRYLKNRNRQKKGILNWRHIFFKRTRFTPTAEEVCFTRPSHVLFFSLGRCVPIVRGDGVYQQGMNYCVEKLEEKEWVHIFAEGIINKSKEKMRLKWGVGRLVSECDITPKVLPIFHVGFDSILPNKKPYIPLIGKRVTIVIGPTLDFTSVVAEMKRQNKTKVEMRKYITDRIQEEMHSLSDKANELHSSKLPVKQT